MVILTVGGWLARGREGSPLLNRWFGGSRRGNRKPWEVHLSETKLKKNVPEMPDKSLLFWKLGKKTSDLGNNSFQLWVALRP